MQQAGNMIKADTGKENVHICYPLDCIPSPRPPPIFVRRDCKPSRSCTRDICVAPARPLLRVYLVALGLKRPWASGTGMNYRNTPAPGTSAPTMTMMNPISRLFPRVCSQNETGRLWAASCLWRFFERRAGGAPTRPTEGKALLNRYDKPQPPRARESSDFS